MRHLQLSLSVALAALLIGLGYLAVRAGIADVLRVSAQADIDGWVGNRKPPRIEEWRLTSERMGAAHTLDPANPEITTKMGWIYEWAAIGKPPENIAVLAFRRQALTYFRSAAKRRPVSAYSWSDIALVKSRLKQPDSEFISALKHATFLGPWEPAVQLAIADAGLLSWDSLVPEQRAIVQDTLKRGSRMQPGSMVDMARLHKRMNVLCGIGDASLAPVCAKK